MSFKLTILIMLLSYVTSFIHTKHNLSLKKSIILNRDIKSMITIHDRSSFIKSSKSPLISTISPTTRPTTRTITKLSMSDDDNDDNDNVDTFNNENNENIDSTAFGDHVPKVRRLERRAGAKRQRHQSEISNSSLRSLPSHIPPIHITNNPSCALFALAFLSPQLNSVTLVGRIGQQPNPRYFDNGNVVVNVSLAVKRKYHPLERKVRDVKYGDEETDWFPLEIWGRDAEYCGKFVKKGARVGVR